MQSFFAMDRRVYPQWSSCNSDHFEPIHSTLQLKHSSTISSSSRDSRSDRSLIPPPKVVLRPVFVVTVSLAKGPSKFCLDPPPKVALRKRSFWESHNTKHCFCHGWLWTALSACRTAWFPSPFDKGLEGCTLSATRVSANWFQNLGEERTLSVTKEACSYGWGTTTSRRTWSKDFR